MSTPWPPPCTAAMRSASSGASRLTRIPARRSSPCRPTIRLISQHRLASSSRSFVPLFSKRSALRTHRRRMPCRLG
eukprot:3041137-Prymnesium_polylepis.2